MLVGVLVRVIVGLCVAVDVCVAGRVGVAVSVNVGLAIATISLVTVSDCRMVGVHAIKEMIAVDKIDSHKNLIGRFFILPK